MRCPPDHLPEPRAAQRAARSRKGLNARKQGHQGEWLAALYLMAKGYQILGFRLKTPQAEIDLLARKGSILAVVEVKRRQSPELALMALSSDQQERLLNAGNRIVRTRPSLQNLEPRLDLIALSPGRLPRHLKGLTTTQGTAF